jgi:hypothetical protein
MALDHEAPYVALCDRLQLFCGPYLRTPITRRDPSYDNVPPENQPAMFIVATHQTPSSARNQMPAVWTLGALVIVYATATDDPGSSAEPDLNNILTKIDAALLRQTTETPTILPGPTLAFWTTLGGTVQSAIPGPVEVVGGSDAKQGIALMQIEMICNPCA